MKTAFLGGGNMASALAGGLLAGGIAPGSVHVIEPEAPQRARLAERFPGIGLAAQADDALSSAEALVLAVKPQVLRDAIRPLVPFLGASRPVVVSVVAGIRLADIARWLGGYDRLVRAMPNTPALIGQGVAGLFALPQVDAEGRRRAEQILAAGGEVLWVEREAMLDAVTAVSGSGPAYVFYFLEALEQAALDLGFAPDAARKLSYATFGGAVALARSGDTPPGVLRAQVTSKGGTTQRALEHMEGKGVAPAIVEAVKAAAHRAEELGDDFGNV